MNKTKIEWTDMTWNPIKGLCPMGCWYCYARRFYKRFKWNPEIRLDEKELLKPLNLKKPKKIFVCSTIELFHPEIPRHFRNKIFDVMAVANWHTYQILTKLPAFVDREMLANVWLGTSATSFIGQEFEKIQSLLKCKAKIRFVSLEPYLKPYYIKRERLSQFDEWWLKDIDWLIIGGITGVKGPRPTRDDICDLIELAKNYCVPVFIKDNLADIWGEPLIQEFPKGD